MPSECVPVNELVLDRGLSANEMNALLANRGLQRMAGSRWVPTKKGKPYALVVGENASHRRHIWWAKEVLCKFWTRYE